MVHLTAVSGTVKRLMLKSSHYRPLGLQEEVEASRISRQSAHEGGKVVFTLQEFTCGTHFY